MNKFVSYNERYQEIEEVRPSDIYEQLNSYILKIEELENRIEVLRVAILDVVFASHDDTYEEAIGQLKNMYENGLLEQD